jgi:hypothetical protein
LQVPLADFFLALQELLLVLEYLLLVLEQLLLGKPTAKYIFFERLERVKFVL